MKKLILPLVLLVIAIPARAQECDYDNAVPALSIGNTTELTGPRTPMKPGAFFASKLKSQNAKCSVAALFARQGIQEDDHKRIIQQVEQSWSGSAWEDTYRVTAMYDGNGFFSEFFFEHWTGSDWVDDERDTFVNDANGNILETTIEVNFGSGLEPYERQTATFDENGNQETSFAAMWTGTEWEDWFRSYLTYNENNQQTGFMNELFDENLADWVYDFAGIFTYDGQGRQDQIVNQSWNADSLRWEDAIRTTYTYGTNSQQIVFETWNGASMEWVAVLRDTLTFDGEGREVESLSEFWGGTEWVPSGRSTKTYGPNGIESDTVEQWSGTAFVFQARALTIYDGEGCLTEELEQTWDGANWVDSYRYQYGYEPTATSLDDEFEYTRLSMDIYPNPSVDVVNMTVDMDDFRSISVEVYDLLGRKIETVYNGNLPVGKSELSWSAQDTAAGTYFVTLRTNEYVATKSVVVQ